MPSYFGQPRAKKGRYFCKMYQNGRLRQHSFCKQLPRSCLDLWAGVNELDLRDWTILSMQFVLGCARMYSRNRTGFYLGFPISPKRLCTLTELFTCGVRQICIRLHPICIFLADSRSTTKSKLASKNIPNEMKNPCTKRIHAGYSKTAYTI